TTSRKPASRAAPTSKWTGFSIPSTVAYSLIFSRPTWYVVDGHDLPTASVLSAMAGNLQGRARSGILLASRPASRGEFALLRAIRGEVRTHRGSVDLQHGEERLLRHFDPAHGLHPFLARFLLLQQLVLAGYVTAVELCRDVLAQSLDGLAGEDVGADRRLHRHVEELARDRFPQPRHQALALVVGEVAVDDDRERVDLVAGEQDVDLDQVRGLVADRFVVERGVAAGTALQQIEEVEDDLAERHVVADLDPLRAQVGHVDVGAAAPLAELH